MMTLDWLEISFDFVLFQGSSLQEKKRVGGSKRKDSCGIDQDFFDRPFRGFCKGFFSDGQTSLPH